MDHHIKGFLLPAFLCCIIAAPVARCGQSLRSLTEDDPGDALFLTSLIEEGAIDLARSLAQVGSLPGDGGLLSYAGFLTVNKTYNSNIYFWFFPAEINNETAPVILWLEGGPGGSSLGSLFLENGPFIVGSNLTLLKRETSWSKHHSVLYVDNPVGTGFSFTNDENGYVTNEIEVARDLYNVLIQFFKLFPELQENEFYVSGESYAGKYVPAISYSIHTNNPLADLKINLKGLIIADGYSDPVNMLNYGDYFYQIGLIDTNGREQFKALENLCIQYIQEENWLEAFYAYDDLVANTRRYGSLLSNLTGYQIFYNYLHDKLDFPLYYDPFIQQDYVRQAIKVGNYTFNTGEQVLSKLREDFMQSVKPWIEILLENYKVLIYNGQLDVIVPYPLTVNYLSILEWSGKEDYLNAIRYQWNVGDDLAGYVKTAGNLVEVLVRNAGHLVSLDQPSWGLDLISKFIANIPLHD